MNPAAIEACHADLFTDLRELQLKYSADTVNKIIRVRDTYMSYLKAPSVTDSALIKQITTRFKVSRPTAYSDLAVCKALLPMLGKEAREFHKWRAKEMLLETYRIATAKMDVRTMERVAATYAKVFEISKDDEQQIPIDQILVQPWTPTDDPTILGLQPMPDRDKRIRQLINELSSKNPEIIDITYEEADIQE